MTEAEIKANLREILRECEDIRANDKWFEAVIEAYDMIKGTKEGCVIWRDPTLGGDYFPKDTGHPKFNPYEVTCAPPVTREINTGKTN